MKRYRLDPKKPRRLTAKVKERLKLLPSTIRTSRPVPSYSSGSRHHSDNAEVLPRNIVPRARCGTACRSSRT
jgi:hypothetical protein